MSSVIVVEDDWVWANAVAMWWMTRLREDSEPDNALDFMAAHRKLLQIRLRFIELGTWGGVFLTGFLIAWVPWMLGEHLATYLREPWRAVVGVGGIVLILIFSALMSRRDHRNVLRELEELDRLEGELRGNLND